MQKHYLKTSISLFIALSLVACHLSLFSCKNRRNPNLSENQLLELANESAKNIVVVLPDTNYVPQAGIKYTENRAIDPSAPPVIINIADNINNKKAFKLSDIASSIRYVILQPPPETKLSIVPSTRTTAIGYSITSDDEHIFINTREGLFCYSTDGRYLYTVVRNQEIDGRTYGTTVFGNIDLLNGKLIVRINSPGANGVQLSFFDVKEMYAHFFLNNQSAEIRNYGIKPQYKRELNRFGYRPFQRYLFLDDQTIFVNNLTITSLYGDTLCKFNDYYKPTVIGPQNSGTDIFRFNGQIMLRRELNDTIFKVIPPNRLLPSYIMNWGKYKPDINIHASGAPLIGKFVFNKWIETPRFIFIYYSEELDLSISRQDREKYRNHLAIYNKNSKTLTHHATSDIFDLIENDIEPIGMPFLPEGINHKGEMYMIFTKESIKRIIDNRSNQNDKLKTIYENLTDGEICIMIVN